MSLELGIQVAYAAARLAGRLRRRTRLFPPLSQQPAEPGISVVIPSRNGKHLLAAQLPGILQDLPPAGEVLVIDNGSDDGTAQWLQSSFRQIHVEVSPTPISFARAANRGLAAARYSRICLLNNDMLIDPGFFTALERAFDRIPGLFCATAQIRFPPGVRREETGKAVMAQDSPDDFPLRCDEPLPGEDLTYVLYGSGGCSLYDAALLRALGGVDTTYEPAYVEDLDLGFRAWQRGWPSVYVSGARVEHRHRATTSRYYTPQELDAILETNYLKFLARSVWSDALFRRLWKQAVDRLLRRAAQNAAARDALLHAFGIAMHGGPAEAPKLAEDSVLALTNGTVFVFPGRAPASVPPIVVAGRSPQQPPAPLGRPEVLVSFAEQPGPPPRDVLEGFVETVVVQRGPAASLAFGAALQQTLRKWRPEIVELHGPEAAPHADECVPARTVLL